MILPVILYFLIFKYGPMYGLQIAFKDYLPIKGFLKSPWVEFKHFIRFFNSYNFMELLKNTIGISIYQLVIGFPVPILLALLMNEVGAKHFKKFVQTATYAPHFLSTVVLVGMLAAFLSPRNGLINQIIVFFGGKPIYFMAEAAWFKTLYVFSGVWQNAGWSSIVYMATLSGIDVQMYEAAIIDGASRLKRMIYLTIPFLMPTIVILLIMEVGKIMDVGFEKVFLMQNQLNIGASDVISTYVYTVGIYGSQFSYSTAIGLFNAVINFILLIAVNYASKKLTENSLW
ncbi:MAG: sugar transporter permease [Clostridiales bacterium]|jgi:putative aldouronate transport system permease protein|nr:sugar transporter permease [Clostridiales bacterium]